MPFASVLLRLLLIALLIASATTSAVAGMRMSVADAHRAAAIAAQADEPPCHMAAHANPKPAPEIPGVPDCCKAGQCDGICLHAVPALPAALAATDVVPLGLFASAGDTRGHDAPPPARLQRPPIA